MSDRTCRFCGTEFSTKSIMIKHQRTAKYCLKLQGKVVMGHRCHFCLKKYTQKIDLYRHQMSCTKQKVTEAVKEKNRIIEERDIQIEELKEQIKDLQDKLENIAISAVSRPTITNKNTINNYIAKLEIITDEHLLEQASNLTIEHIQKGPKGYAEYALEYPLKNRIVCVDYSRRKVKFKDKEGNVITDPEMGRLTSKFFGSIKDKNHTLIVEYGEQLKREDFCEEDIDKLVEIASYKIGVEKASEGERSEFYHDFVKNVCGQTVVE